MKFVLIFEKHLGKEAKKEMMGIQDGDVPVTWADMEEFRNVFEWSPKVMLPIRIEKLIMWFVELRSQFNFLESANAEVEKK